MVFYWHLSPTELLNMPLSELNWLYDEMCDLSAQQAKEMSRGNQG